MTAIAKACAALFGTSETVVNGLTCSATSPATMTVQIGAGEIYQIEPIEATACGTLPQNTAYSILKQGIQLGTYTTSTLATPGTSGQSINYLIEAQYQDQDLSLDPTTGNSPVVLQFYDAATPSSPWSGPNNAGTSSNTFRDGIVAYQVKAGVAAASGSQVTPTPDTGYVGLWVVTVPYGATSLTSANIAQYAGAPILQDSVLQMLLKGNGNYAVDAGVANAYVVTPTGPVPDALTDGLEVSFYAAHPNTTASTLNAWGSGAKPLTGMAGALQGGEIVTGMYRAKYSTATGGFQLIGQGAGALQVAPATQSEHAVQMGQIQAQAGTAFTSAGTAPAYTITPTPAVTNTAPTRLRVKFPSAGTTGSNTLAASGQSALPLMQYAPGGTLIPATITAGLLSDCECDGTHWIVLDPVSAPGGFSGYGTISASRSLTVSDIGQALFASANNCTLTLPTPTSLGVVSGAAVLIFTDGETGTVVTAGSGVTLNGPGGASSSITMNSGQSMTIVAVGTTTWQVVSSTASLGANGDFGSSLGGAGYQKLPGGLIIQWGYVTTNSSGVATFTHPIAFPNNNFRVFVTYQSGILTANFVNGGGGTLTASTACVSNVSNAAVSGAVVNFFVIGD